MTQVADNQARLHVVKHNCRACHYEFYTMFSGDVNAEMREVSRHCKDVVCIKCPSPFLDHMVMPSDLFKEGDQLPIAMK